MSTKTTFKRIALVAVAALGLGVLSVAPSQAAVSSYQIAVDANDTISTGESATATVTQSFFTTADNDSVTVAAIVRSGGSNTGGVRVQVSDSFTSTVASGGLVTNTFRNGDLANMVGVTSAAAPSTVIHGSGAAGVSATAKYRVVLYNVSVAGTYYVDFNSYSPVTGVAVGTVATWTVTVKAAAGPDATSTSFIGAGSAIAPTNADSTTITAVKTVGTIAANILTTQKTLGVATSAPESITATISGAGTLGVHGSAPSSATATGRSLLVKHDNYVVVLADGTSGPGTVTLTGSVSGTVYKTATVTFYDSKPATVTATVKKAYPAAGRTTTAAVFVVVKDSSGNLVQNAVVDLNPATTGTGETTTACAYSATYSANVCSVTGTSTAKFGKVSYLAHVTGVDTAETEISSAAFDLTFADIVATKVVLSAPASGSVGDKVTVTLTATEKNGYPVADSTYEGGSANGSVGGIFWNTTTVPAYSSAAFAPFNAGETITTTSGVATKDLYLPAVSGTVTGTWTLAGTAAAGITTGAIDKTISGSTAAISIAVTNPGVDAATDAANEATDAANAATDAALAAADAADAATAAAQDASDAVAALSATVAKLVASLKAQITSLTNLVIKIQKKVKA